LQAYKRKCSNHKDREACYCNLELILEYKEDEWYIESACLTHMIGDQNKFVSLKRKIGNVVFGDNSFVKILGKGALYLGSEHVKTEIFLLVEDLKRNILSVSKMYDQWYNILFDSWK